jgi:hypothetical protein
MLNPPSVELGVLLRAVTGAEYLALLGSPSWGYDLLVGHLDQAEEAARDGCPWAQEFLSAYRLALAEYVRSQEPAVSVLWAKRQAAIAGIPVDQTG